MQAIILSVLKHYENYDQPITVSQLHSFLPKRISFRQLKKEVDDLILCRKIDKSGEYLSLKQSVFKNFKKNKVVASRMLKFAGPYLKIISFLPFIRGVGISGSLALGAGRDGDDVDFFIITSDNSAWIARIFALAIARIYLFLRGESIDTFCLNLFFETSSLSVPKPRQNLQSAREILQVLPVINKKNIFKKLYKDNPYVFKYFPNRHNVVKFDRQSTISNPKAGILLLHINKGVSLPQKFWLGLKRVKIEEYPGQIWLC